MALSVGDKVKNRYNISGGLFGTDIPSETSGKIVKIHWLSDTVDVEFVRYGSTHTVRDIDVKDVVKQY